MATTRKSKNHNRQSKSRPISVCVCLIIPYIFDNHET